MTFPDIYSDILDSTSLDHWSTGQLTPSQFSLPPFIFFLDPPLGLAMGLMSGTVSCLTVNKTQSITFVWSIHSLNV